MNKTILSLAVLSAAVGAQDNGVIIGPPDDGDDHLPPDLTIDHSSANEEMGAAMEEVMDLYESLSVDDKALLEKLDITRDNIQDVALGNFNPFGSFDPFGSVDVSQFSIHAPHPAPKRAPTQRRQYPSSRTADLPATLTVPCPRCGAVVGQACLKATLGRFKQHKARLDLYRCGV